MPQPKKDNTQRAVPINLVDTNVLLRFLMGDDPPKAARAAALMERVERSEELIEIPVEVLTETIWTLESFYQVPRPEAAAKLAALLTLPGVQPGAREIFLKALQNYASSNIDFVDCLLAAQASIRRMQVYTFDEHDFKKLKANWKAP